MNDSTVIELLRALGDPVRWGVVSHLRGGTRCACELAEATGVAPSLLSHHLGVLRDTGVVAAQRRGRWIDYALVDGVLEDLADEVGGTSAAHGGVVAGAGRTSAIGELVAG